MLFQSLTPPIFVEEHGDLTIYPTAAEAEAAVEAIDVRNGEYRFFDSQGLVLDAEVQRGTSPRGRQRKHLAASGDRVSLVVPEAQKRRPDDLAEILCAFLSLVGSSRTGNHRRSA